DPRERGPARRARHHDHGRRDGRGVGHRGAAARSTRRHGTPGDDVTLRLLRRIAASRSGRRLVPLVVLALVAALSGSCAFYNTYYFARKNYDLATGGMPYDVAPDPQQAGTAAQYYRKSIDYSKKLIANYPKSKWVDDAYLMWARSL